MPMYPQEYLAHVRESFEDKYFDGDDGFIFSKAALVDGLSDIEGTSMWFEQSLDKMNESNRDKVVIDELVIDELIYISRRLQACANILRISLDGMRLQNH